jgi:hypothetical protein
VVGDSRRIRNPSAADHDQVLARTAPDLTRTGRPGCFVNMSPADLGYPWPLITRRRFAVAARPTPAAREEEMAARFWSALAVTAVALAVTLFAYTDAGAVVVDGSCSASELEALECANFGTPSVVATLEIVEPFPVLVTAAAAQPCRDPNTNAAVQCTIWQYKRLPVAVSASLQNILVPASLSMLTPPGFPAGSLGSCTLFTGGAGDPTSGFGKGITAFNTCRLAVTAGNPNPTPNIVFATSPALPAMVPTQLKTGAKLFPALILGPGNAGVPTIATTTETSTMVEGVSLTTEFNQAGQLLSATVTGGGTAVVIPDGGIVLCHTTDLGAIGGFPGSGFPGSWTCQKIVFDDGKNIQAGENSCGYRRLATGQYIVYPRPPC